MWMDELQRERLLAAPAAMVRNALERGHSRQRRTRRAGSLLQWRKRQTLVRHPRLIYECATAIRKGRPIALVGLASRKFRSLNLKQRINITRGRRLCDADRVSKEAVVGHEGSTVLSPLGRPCRRR